MDACSLFVLGGEGWEDGLQIGGGGDVKLFGGLRRGGQRTCEYHDKK